MYKLKILYLFISIPILISEFSFSQPLLNACRNGSIPIPDHSTVKDSVQVSLGGAEVRDINLRIINLTHTWVSDLNIYLQKGTVGIKVVNMVGGSGDNFINTILDDSALIPISSGTAPFTGSFQPFSPLNIFNNMLTDGYWKILITDTVTGDTGNLSGWCLVLKYQNPPLGGIHTVEIPNTYRLYQNYPNPFNPVSKIKYGVPKNGYVKLAVYDEIGRLVAILEDGVKQANTYEVEFDATNLPSGVYYYKLEADGFSETKKMVLVK